MVDRIRWGVLATGGIARAFAEDLRLLPDAELVAVGSRAGESARRFADAYGVPRAHGSWQALAEDDGVDVIYVATPHAAHHAAALTCLRAGRPVLVEKPFTLDVAQATELVTVARERGVFCMEAMWTRCLPAVRRLAGMVADGVLGEVVSVFADFGAAAPDDPAHRVRARELGGGALLDLGVYPVSFAHLVLGEPATVAAYGALGPTGVDENTGLVLGYGSGAVALLACSLRGDTGQRATVAGTRARVELPRGFWAPKGFVVYRPGGGVEEVDLPFEGCGYHFEAAEVGRCLREGLTESPLVPHGETLAVMRTLDAVRAGIGLSY